MLTDQLNAFEIVVLDDQSVAALPFVRRKGPDSQMVQNVLFVAGGLAVAGWVSFHGPQRKKAYRECPAKSFNPASFKSLGAWGHAR